MALNQPDKVAQATQERIHAAIEALGYIPNLAANPLRSERSGVVVAIVPTIENSVFSDTIQGISDVLDEANYKLLLGCAAYSFEKEEGLIKAFLGRRPDGLILTGTVHTPLTKNLLSTVSIPVVEMWYTSEKRIDMSVGFDNFQVGHAIAQCVIDIGYRLPMDCAEIPVISNNRWAIEKWLGI